MRFKINFTRTGRQAMLPMNYQYYICAWIYHVLKAADKDYALFLHEKGYGHSATKLYKLFCFSRLNFGKPTLWKDKQLFEIHNNTLELKIAFDIPQAATHFVQGLFSEQQFYLGNKFNGLDLKVISVQALPEPEFHHSMNYRLETPWVVSWQDQNEKYPRYLSPDNPEFISLAIKHITQKFQNTHQNQTITNPLNLQILSDNKRSGFIIKPDTPQQTRIVGNLFRFSLDAPPAVHQMIWNSGISEKSPSGFGWVELKSN